MMDADPSFCSCLRRIAGLLERGQAEEAAALLPELRGIMSQPPLAMPPAELEEARHLLGRCVAVGGTLRQDVLASLQRMGAGRKSIAHYQHRP
jgi:hypothetical protein